MIQPRNSLVVLRLLNKSNRTFGGITVPTTNDLFTEAEVIAVGPGNVSAEGGRSETFDLKPGQLVYVRHKQETPRGKMDAYTPYNEGDQRFGLFVEASIVGILAEQGQWKPEPDGVQRYNPPTIPALILPN
jgi:co-chaperonin GroES (HSP10)